MQLNGNKYFWVVMTKCCHILISRLWWSDILKGKSDQKCLSKVLCFTRLQRSFNSPEDDSWIKFLWWWWRALSNISLWNLPVGLRGHNLWFTLFSNSSDQSVSRCALYGTICTCLLRFYHQFSGLFEQPPWGPNHLNPYLQCLYSLSLYWLIFFETSAFKTTLSAWIFTARGMWENNQGKQTLLLPRLGKITTGDPRPYA